jgi:hypothetical protein
MMGISMRKTYVIAALCTLLMLSGCIAYKLVPAQTTAVSKAGMSVTPTTAWNKSPANPGLNAIAEVWTQDGPLLNQLTFIAGLKDGQTLIKAARGADTKPPLFKSSMLPQDIVEFVEKSFRVQTTSPIFNVTNVTPATFSGQAGVQFDFDFTTQDEVRRKGRAIGAVKNGLLYLVIYEGAAVYYYDRNLAEFEKIAASAQIKG